MTRAGRIALGLGFAAVAVAGEAAFGVVGVDAPLLLAYPAVIAAAWWGGLGAGLVTASGAALGLAYFVLPPTGSFALAVERDALDLALFGVLSLLIVHGVTRVRRGLDVAETGRETATAARDTMAAVVAHDLRNPLQTIGLNVELLSPLYRHDVRATAAIARLRRSTELARRLVENILDAARVGEPFPLELAPWPVRRLVEESVEPFEALAEERSVRLAWHLDDDVPLVCDRARVVQVLTSLLSNAFQFTPRGGAVTVEARRAPSGVRFVVRDTGEGIPKAELPHVFERNWHDPRPGHGSGLGLWIAEAIVEAHGSRITVASEVGGGTTMTFVLPPAPRAPRRATAPLAPVPA